MAEGTFEIATLHVMNLAVTNVKSKLRLFPKQVLFDDLGFKFMTAAAAGTFPSPSRARTPITAPRRN